MKKSLRITSSIIVLALIISLIMPSISGAFYSLPDDNQSDELISLGAEYTDGEIIVGFIKNEQSEDDKEESDAETLMETKDSGKDIDICVVDTNGKSVEDAIREYKKKPNVAFAEPNYKVEDNAESPDYTQYEYYPTDVTGGMNVPDWNTDTAARSDGAVVAVIDTGIDYTHEDLQDVMWNEGLNYPSLVEMGGGAHGFNSGAYAEGDKEHTDDPSPPEDLDHGTHVAGIVAASWNDYGVSGVTNGSKIMAIRTVGSDGRIRLGSVVAAIDYMCKAKDAGVNVVVANNSWALKYLSHAIVCAVKEADKRGIICVFGSGNEIANLDRTDSTIYMLRQLPNVIVVNASDSKGTRACFSNYGQYTTDIFAPGTDMLSTVPSSDRYADARLSTPVIKNDFESDSNLKVESYDFDGNVMPHTWTDNKGYNDSNGYIKTNDDGRDTIITCTEDLSVKRPQYLTFMMEKERVYNKDEVHVFYNRIDGEEGFVSDKGICENGRWSSVSIKLPDDFDYENFEIKLEFPVYQHDKTHDDPDNTVRIDNVMLTSDAWSYYRMSGTSMAAPVVTGEVATIATQYPMESSEKIVARTLGSAAKNDNLTNMCVTGGVANLNNALNENYSPVVQNAKFRGNQLVVDGYFFKDKGQLYIDDNPVNVISWSDNEIVADAGGIDSSKRFVKVEVKNNNIDGFDRGSRYIPFEENRTDFVEVGIPEEMDKMAHVNQSAVSLGDCIYFATADYMNMNIFITEYNTKTGEWYEVTRDSTYRLQSGQLVVYKGKIIIIAGVKNGDKYETRLLEYDPSTRSITYEDIDNIEMPYSPTLVNYKGEILVLAKRKRSDSGIESNDVIYKIDFDNKKLIEAGESSNLPGSMSIPFYDTLGNVYIGFSEQSNTVSKVIKKEDNTFDIEVIEENLLPTPIVDPNTQRPEYSLAFSKEGIITTASDTFSDSGEVLRDTYLGSIGTDGNITFSNTGKLYNSTMSIRPMSVVNGNKYYVIASYYGSKAHGKTLRYLEGYNELVPEGFLSDQRSDSNNDHSTPVSRNDTDDRVTIKVPKVPKTGDKKDGDIEIFTLFC